MSTTTPHIRPEESSLRWPSGEELLVMAVIANANDQFLNRINAELDRRTVAGPPARRNAVAARVPVSAA